MILGLFESVEQYLQTVAADRIDPIRGPRYTQIAVDMMRSYL